VFALVLTSKTGENPDIQISSHLTTSIKVHFSLYFLLLLPNLTSLAFSVSEAMYCTTIPLPVLAIPVILDADSPKFLAF
jgi:hypothetical protein